MPTFTRSAEFKPMTSVTVPTGSISLAQCVKDRKERTLRWEEDIWRLKMWEFGVGWVYEQGTLEASIKS